MQYLLKTSDLSIRKMEDDIMDYLLMAKWLSAREVLEYIEGISNPYDLDKVIKKTLLVQRVKKPSYPA